MLGNWQGAVTTTAFANPLEYGWAISPSPQIAVGGYPGLRGRSQASSFPGNGYVKQNAARTRFDRARTDVSDEHRNIHLTSHS